VSVGLNLPNEQDIVRNAKRRKQGSHIGNTT